MQITTTAKVKLTKADIIDAIDRYAVDHNIERTGPCEFRVSSDLNVRSVEFDGIVKPDKKK